MSARAWQARKSKPTRWTSGLLVWVDEIDLGDQCGYVVYPAGMRRVVDARQRRVESQMRRVGRRTARFYRHHPDPWRNSYRHSVAQAAAFTESITMYLDRMTTTITEQHMTFIRSLGLGVPE